MLSVPSFTSLRELWGQLPPEEVQERISLAGRLCSVNRTAQLHLLLLLLSNYRPQCCCAVISSNTALPPMCVGCARLCRCRAVSNMLS